MAAAAPDYQRIGAAFVAHYYNVFDTSRPSLAPLYRPSSLLTFEGEPFMGVEAIMTKLTSLPFAKVVHQVATSDYQPVMPDAVAPGMPTAPASVLVFVSGSLMVDDSPNPLKFSQVFHLAPDPANPTSFWVRNDMFRLNYA